ncbi:MAG: AAA family ATPase [Patescibacteria group bacterium]
MSLICITGHQGTGKSTLLNELRKQGFVAYGLDEEKVAGYFNLTTNAPSINVPQGLNRNPEWRKENVWHVDVAKVRNLAVALDGKPTFYLGYAVNIEDLWDISDEIIILQLNDDITKSRLEQRTSNSFGKHPGELELAITNSDVIYKKAISYAKHPVHFVDASLNTQDIASKIIKLTS